MLGFCLAPELRSGCAHSQGNGCDPLAFLDVVFFLLNIVVCTHICALTQTHVTGFYGLPGWAVGSWLAAVVLEEAHVHC